MEIEFDDQEYSYESFSLENNNSYDSDWLSGTTKNLRTEL